ncbi:MAG TPA: transposase [Chloroflexota bacterium]|nr:transposase [Chloroflexota bacterium]
MVERSPAAILRWSWWRRWHQAWARYYHYRRREGRAQRPRDDLPAAPPADLLDVVWHRLAPLLPPTHRRGRPYAHDRRLVLQAIAYVMQTGCAWHTLPSSFPPWQTVYAQLVRWRKTGIWDKIWVEFDKPHPTEQLQL